MKSSYVSFVLTIAFTALLSCRPSIGAAETIIASSSGLTVVSPDGNSTALITSTPALGVFFHASSSRIYFTTTGNTIRRIDYDGNNEQEVVAAQAFSTPVDVVVDDGTNSIIWTDSTNAQVLRSNLDGTNVTSLYNGLSKAGKIFLDTASNLVYVTGLGEILAIPTDGSPPTLTLNDSGGTGDLGSIFVRSGKIYWSNTSTGTIKRANTDGTDIETILNTGNAADVQGIAYDSGLSKILYLSGTSGTSSIRSIDEAGAADAPYSLITGTDLEGEVSPYPSFATPTPTPSPTFTPTLPPPTPTNTPSPTNTSTPTPTPTATPVRNTREYMSIFDPAGALSKIIWTDYRKEVHPVIGNDTASAPTALAYSTQSGLLYFINMSGNGSDLYSATPEGGNVTKLATFSETIDFMVADNTRGKLFFQSISSKEIFFTDLDGQNKATFVTGTNFGRGIFLTPAAEFYYPYPTLFWLDGGAVFAKKTDSSSEVFRLYSCETSASMTALVGASLSKYFLACNDQIDGARSLPLASGGYFDFATSKARLPFTPTVLGIQSLNPAIFSASHVIYAAWNNIVYIHIAIPEYPDPAKNQFVAPFLSFGSGTQVKSIIEVPIDAAIGIPTPTPTPPSDPTYGSIIGKLGASDLFQSPTIASPAIIGATVYLRPPALSDLAAGTSSFEQEARVTVTDKNGVYRFDNVAPGEYTLSFRRDDLTFFDREILVAPGREVPTILVQPLDLESVECKAKVVSSKIAAASNKALSISRGLLKQASAAIKKSKDPAKLTAAAAIVASKVSNVIDAASDLVTAELVCKKTSACIKLNARDKNKAFTTAVKALKRASVALSKKVAATYPRAKQATKRAALLRTIEKTSAASLKKAKTFSKKSYDCGDALLGSSSR